MPQSLLAPPAHLRALAWVHLEAGVREQLGQATWDELRQTAGGPSEVPDPFEPFPAAAFATALRLLDERHGRGDGALVRDAGRWWAAAWARDYRTLTRRLRGQPRRAAMVLASEVLPWLLDEPEAAALHDTGPTSIVLQARGPLPPAFVLGLLEGFLALAGVEGITVARQGERLAASWERAAPAESPAAMLVRLVRWPYLAAAVAPVVLGAALAWGHGAFDAPLLALTLASVVAFQLATNAAGDWFDRRADTANPTPTPFSGGSRVLQRGAMAPRALLALAGGLYALGIAGGLFLALNLQAQAGTGFATVLGLGVAGAAFGVLYTAPPVRLAHRGLGELAVGLGFGPLLVAGTFLVQSIAAGQGSAVPLDVLAFSLPLGALVAAALIIHEVPDAPWDALAGKRTLVVRLGPEGAVHAIALLLGFAYASLALAALAFAAWPTLLALLTAPFAVRAWRHLRAHHASPYRLVPANMTAALLPPVTGLLLAGGIVLARLVSTGV